MSLSYQILMPVVDGQVGVMEVVFENSGSAAINGLKLFVVHNGVPAGSEAMGSLAYLPSQPDGGYVVDSLAAGASVRRSFAVLPKDAEAGKTYSAQITASYAGSDPVVITAEIYVEARPEVYAMIGAAERLRQVMLGAYDNFKDVGRQVSKGKAMPDTQGEYGHLALQPGTFHWALGMVQNGTRLFKMQREDAIKTPAGPNVPAPPPPAPPPPAPPAAGHGPLSPAGVVAVEGLASMPASHGGGDQGAP
jgi:hypothetical protein